MSSGSASSAGRALVAAPMDEVGQEISAFCAASNSSALAGW
jgi:hypothetical protein